MDIRALMKDVDEMREHDHVTVTELCREAGISRKAYYQWLKGERLPNLYNFNRVLEALGIELIPMPVMGSI